VSQSYNQQIYLSKQATARLEILRRIPEPEYLLKCKMDVIITVHIVLFLLPGDVREAANLKKFYQRLKNMSKPELMK